MADGGAGRSWLRAGLTSGRVWKVLGVAGVAGVAATGQTPQYTDKTLCSAQVA